jgi:hypothetical protein
MCANTDLPEKVKSLKENFQKAILCASQSRVKELGDILEKQVARTEVLHVRERSEKQQIPAAHAGPVPVEERMVLTAERVSR